MASQKKNRFNPLAGDRFEKCRICKQKTHQINAKYCQDWSHRGICSMCGTKILKTKNYRSGHYPKLVQLAFGEKITLPNGQSIDPTPKSINSLVSVSDFLS